MALILKNKLKNSIIKEQDSRCSNVLLSRLLNYIEKPNYAELSDVSCCNGTNREPKVATFSGNFARCLAKYAKFCVSIGFALLAIALRGLHNLRAEIQDLGAEF